MAYSLIEQHSRDLDIFLRDSKKLIHFASGGGLLPYRAISSDSYNNSVLDIVFQEKIELEIEINPNLTEILNLTQDRLPSYLISFVELAKRGFFTYDKSKLGEFEDQIFHLVAKPKSTVRPHLLYEKHKIFEIIVNAKSDFPIGFTPFDISQYV